MWSFRLPIAQCMKLNSSMPIVGVSNVTLRVNVFKVDVDTQVFPCEDALKANQRTKASIVTDGQAALQINEHVNGVNGLSYLLELKNLFCGDAIDYRQTFTGRHETTLQVLVSKR